MSLLPERRSDGRDSAKGGRGACVRRACTPPRRRNAGETHATSFTAAARSPPRGAQVLAGPAVLPRLTISNGKRLEGGERPALEPRDQLLGRGAADLDDRRADARQRRRLRRAEVGVVDAGDRDVVRDRARRAARHATIAPTAKTSLVATTAVGRRAGSASSAPSCRRRPPGRSGRSGRSARRARARPAASAARTPAPRARRAVVAVGRRAEQAEAAVAEREQVARHRVRRGAVVEADARVPAASGRRPRSARRGGRSPRAARTAPGRGRGRRRRTRRRRAGSAARSCAARRQVVVVLGEHQRIAALASSAACSALVVRA